MRRDRSSLGFNAPHCLVGCQFELADLRVGEASDTLGETCFRDRPHLKGERHRGLRWTILGGVDYSRSRESRAVEVCSQRNDENGLKHACQSVTLSHYDGAASGLFARTVRTKIGPPDFAALFTADPRDRAHPPSHRGPPRPAPVACALGSDTSWRACRNHTDARSRGWRTRLQPHGPGGETGLVVTLGLCRGKEVRSSSAGDDCQSRTQRGIAASCTQPPR